MSTALLAQNKNFSIGLVGTSFSTVNNDNSLSQIENPLGYGVIAGYQINDNLHAAITAEYFEGDIREKPGNERDIRTNLSLFVTPIKIDFMSPYFSAGIVHTNREIDYENRKDETLNKLNGRIGIGVDFTISNNAGFNLDFGFYNNGYDFIGLGSSIGFRVNLF
jgi:opacity protein-like surface antigen